MNIAAAIQSLRARNVPVPRPMRLPTEKEIEQVEARIGTIFQPDYRHYLLSASDVVFGTLEPGTITEPESHTYLPEIIKSARAYGVPKHLFPICEDNADFYCLTKSGEVIFWSHNGPTNQKWKDLASWIQQVWLSEGNQAL